MHCLYYSSICLYTCNSPILPDCVSHTFPCITHPLTLIVAFLHTYFVVLLVICRYISPICLYYCLPMFIVNIFQLTLLCDIVLSVLATSLTNLPFHLNMFQYIFAPLINHLLWEYFFCLPEYIEHCPVLFSHLFPWVLTHLPLNFCSSICLWTLFITFIMAARAGLSWVTSCSSSWIRLDFSFRYSEQVLFVFTLLKWSPGAA